jgi:hypothetical protein
LAAVVARFADVERFAADDRLVVVARFGVAVADAVVEVVVVVSLAIW